MKNIMQWILAVVCLVTVGNLQVMAESENDEDVKVSIPISTSGSLNGGVYRDDSCVPFTAYYQGGTIYINTSAEFSSIIISVKNETTHQAWSVTTDISDGMGEISIINGGAGSYSVEIVTEYGECFVGSFRS